MFGRFVSVHQNGLTATQWAYCLLIALVTFPINLLLKYVPDTMCLTLGDEDPEDVRVAEEDYQVLRDKGERNAKEIAMRKASQ